MSCWNINYIKKSIIKMHYSFDWAAIFDDRLLKINFIIYFAMEFATKKFAKNIWRIWEKTMYIICVSPFRVWYAYFLHRRLLNQSNRLCDKFNEWMPNLSSISTNNVFNALNGMNQSVNEAQQGNELRTFFTQLRWLFFFSQRHLCNINQPQAK